jgi:hypothetical protein
MMDKRSRGEEQIFTEKGFDPLLVNDTLTR